MIVYEKNNKLNINFENSLENPDIEFGKSEIKVDGNNIVSGGGGSEPYIVDMIDVGDGRYDANKTWQEIHDAYMSGVPVFIHLPDDIYEYHKDSYFTAIGIEEQPNDHMYNIYFYRPGDTIRILGAYDDPNGYPSFSTE